MYIRGGGTLFCYGEYLARWKEILGLDLFDDFQDSINYFIVLSV